MALNISEIEKARARAIEYFDKASIVITDNEKERIEVADFGLGELNSIGLELIVYIATERCSAKEIVLFPYQICPEHRHPPLGSDNPGKEETFRCRWGEVYLYVEGEPTNEPAGLVPEGRKSYFTAWHEVILRPGEQYLLAPNTRHWFQGGPDGAVISEFSTKNVDELDIFTDPDIQRILEII